MKKPNFENLAEGSIFVAIIIAILLVASMATALLIDGTNTIMVTAVRLEGIKWSIAEYNELSIKTDKETEKAKILQDERISMMNSKDWRINIYANAHAVFKLIIILICIAIDIIIVVAWYQPIKWIRNYFRKRARRRKMLIN